MRTPSFRKLRVWFVEWAGWTGCCKVPECSFCGASLPSLEAVLKEALRRGHPLEVAARGPGRTKWEAYPLNAPGLDLVQDAAEPLHAALKVLWLVVKEGTM